MKDIIILIVTIIFLIIVLLTAFKPKIDIIKIEPNKHKILLWYDSFKDTIIYRKQIEINKNMLQKIIKLIFWAITFIVLIIIGIYFITFANAVIAILAPIILIIVLLIQND